jgi:hypothetical protein
MPTREIPRQEWISFFDRFSDTHRGWPVTLEMMADDLGDQTEIRDLPLEGISAELRATGAAEIQIVAGNQPDRHINDTIVNPSRVWLKQGGQPADDVLEIESETRTALIRFRSSIPLRS